MSAATVNSLFPAFPGGAKVDVAPLQTVDFGKLLARDHAEVQKLLSACVTHGFFYLDLQTSDVGRKILEDEQGVLRFMENYFAQPRDVKMLDDRQSFLHG